MDRETRRLIQTKQEKIKEIKHPPQKRQGVTGDMVIFQDSLYIKTRNQWLKLMSGDKVVDQEVTKNISAIFSAGAAQHSDLTGVSENQHHNRQHSLTSGSDHTGTLSVAMGGTGVTSSTGSTNTVLSTAPTFENSISINADDASKTSYIILKDGVSNRMTIGADAGSTDHAFIQLANDYDLNIMDDSGSSIMYLDEANKRIGINDATPDAKLDVYSNADDEWTALFDQDHATGYGVKITGDMTGTDPLLKIESVSTQLFRVQGDGKVGIGTGVPPQQLSVHSSSGGIIALNREDTDTANNEVLGKFMFGSDDPSDGTFNTGATIEAQSAGNWGSGDYGAKLIFSTTADDSNSLIERMRISDDGNVGIGGANVPDTTLEIFSGTTNQLKLSFDATDNCTFGVDTAGDLTINPSGDDIFVGATGTNVRIGSYNYASGTTDWAITGDGDADFRYLYVDEMHAVKFVCDLEQALAGGQIISKSVAVVAANFDMVGNDSTVNFIVNDLPSANDMAVFEEGDFVRFRSFSRAGGSLTIADAWGLVYGYTDDPGGVEGQQQWTFQRAPSGHGGTMSAGTTIAKDALVLDYGASGQGYYEVNAIDGKYGRNSPYAQMVTWKGDEIAPLGDYGKMASEWSIYTAGGVTATRGIVTDTYYKASYGKSQKITIDDTDFGTGAGVGTNIHFYKGATSGDTAWGVESGKRYQYVCAAKASASRNVLLQVRKTTADYNVRGLNVTLALTTDWQLFTGYFTANATETHCRISIMMAGHAADVWIGECYIYDANGPANNLAVRSRFGHLAGLASGEPEEYGFYAAGDTATNYIQASNVGIMLKADSNTYTKYTGSGIEFYDGNKTMDLTGGLMTMYHTDGSSVASQWASDIVSIGGTVTDDTNCMRATSNSLTFYGGTNTTYAQIGNGSDGARITLRSNSADYVQIDGSGMSIYSGSSSTASATFGTTVTLRGNNSSHDQIAISSTGIVMKEGNAEKLKLADGNITLSGKIIPSLGGDYNVIIGNDDCKDVGSANVILGFDAGESLANVDTGSDAGKENVFIGKEAGGSVTGGNTNVTIGSETMKEGDCNIFIGRKAGNDSTQAQTTQGSGNICIGTSATCNAATTNNETVIGTRITGKGTNTVTIGGPDCTDFYCGTNQNLIFRNGAGDIYTGGLKVTSADSTGTDATIYLMRGNGKTNAYDIGTAAWRFSTDDSANDNLYIYDDIADATRVRVSGSNGDFYTNDGTVHSLSDVRIKKDITDLSDGLNIINQLRPRTFKYNGKTDMTLDDGITRYGFIANEVLSVAPQYVDDNLDEEIDGVEVNDFKALSTTKMIPMMINAIKELSAKVTELESKLA